MKKQAALLFCVLTACTLTACGGKSAAKEENTQIPNPFIGCQTLEDAAETAGFDLAVPDTIGEYTSRTIQAVEGSMIQVFYKNADGSRIYIRKGVGPDDISGDYNDYSETSVEEIGSLQVTMKGENGRISVAVWTSGGYVFAIGAQNAPMAMSAMRALIEGVQ